MVHPLICLAALALHASPSPLRIDYTLTVDSPTATAFRVEMRLHHAPDTLRLAIEEHGAGRQLVRARWWPHARWGSLTLCGLVSALALLAALSDGGAAAIALVALAGGLWLRVAYECAVAGSAIRQALARTFAPTAHAAVRPVPGAFARRHPAPRPRRPDVRDTAR